MESSKKKLSSFLTSRIQAKSAMEEIRAEVNKAASMIMDHQDATSQLMKTRDLIFERWSLLTMANKRELLQVSEALYQLVCAVADEREPPPPYPYN